MHWYHLKMVNIMNILVKIIFINYSFEYNQELEYKNLNSKYIYNCNQTSML